MNYVNVQSKVKRNGTEKKFVYDVYNGDRVTSNKKKKEREERTKLLRSIFIL